MRQRAVATVQRNSYVTLHKHHYSVPVQYVGKRVELVYDTDTIDIFHGFTHVATHHRNDTPYEYTTKPSHNLPGRKGSCESDIAELLSRAAQIDNIVLHYLRAVIEDRRYPGADADGNDRQTPSHRNIRGKEYFAASIKLSANNNKQHGNEQ